MTTTNASLVLHYRMYGMRRTCETFGVQDPVVRKALTDTKACAEAHAMLQETPRTTEDEGEQAVRGFVAYASRVFDLASETDPDSIAAVAKCAEQLDSIMLNRKLSQRLK